MKSYIKELMKKAFTGGAQKTTGTGAINTTNISKNFINTYHFGVV